jgi:fumarylacetoacetase
MKSFVEVPEQSHFPIQNLPYGVFSAGGRKRVGAAIGEYVLDLAAAHEAGLVPIAENVFAGDSLNAFMSLGKGAWSTVRGALIEILREDNPRLRDDEGLRKKLLLPMQSVELHLPVKIGAFVDFYSSENHAMNVGKMLRPDNPLMPNWKHLPVGYNGRASSVVISGTPIRRPMGQVLPQGAEQPIYTASRNLDFELEMGFFTGKENPLGSQVTTLMADEFIFGMVLVNDWSARDIQKWEYQPLGPFLAKSFATTISPWVVTIDALEPFRSQGPIQDPPVLEYLRCDRDWSFDVELQVTLQSEKMSQPQAICRTNFKTMYWNMAQQLAHQGVNGTNIQVGDLYASGTVSGETPDSFGSMLELGWRGERPISLTETGEVRKFLEDGDTVTMTAWCQCESHRIGFGEARGTILPAIGA